MSSDIIIRLLKSVNDDKLRPLECAANNGVLSLFQAFLLTPGIYMIREEDRGIATYQWIDVTEYEEFGVGNRRSCSPLVCLTLLDKDRLKSSYTTSFFNEPIFLKWTENKIKCGVIPGLLNLTIRCILIGVYLVIDYDIGELESSIHFSNSNYSTITNGNNSHNLTDSIVCTSFSDIKLQPFTKNALRSTLLTVASCTFLFDTFEYITNYRPRHTRLFRSINKRYKNVFLQYFFYRRAHSTVNAMICLQVMAALWGYSPNSDFIGYTRIISRTFLWWSILYFIQLIPGTDYFVVSIQSMIGILTQFCVIYIFFLFGYMQLFTITINFNLRQGCVSQFSDMYTATYSTFLAMVNMLDFTQFDIINPFSIYIVHIIYVLVAGILLLNFLVAIMSDQIAETRKYKNVILPIQKLSIVLAMERQLKYLGRWYYSWIQRRVYTVYNERLCIVRVTFHRGNDIEHKLVLGGFL